MQYNFYPFTYPHEKWVYKNRCVIKVEHKMPEGLPDDMQKHWRRFMPESHLCGYVVFPKDKVPSDWWGNYDALGLNSLAIHGNITYCELQDVPRQDEYHMEYRNALEALYKEWEETKETKENPFDYINKKMAIKKEYIRKLSQTSEGFVVFGFDCNHSGDVDNPAVHDVNHVMMLTEQMEQQLLLFADRYEEYKNADKVPATTDIVRLTIMREIRRQAELKTEMGLGGMLDILTGKAPMDDLPE